MIFKRHCIAKMSMIEDLCKELNSQRADVVRPCIHVLLRSMQRPVAIQRLQHLINVHAKGDDQEETPVLAFNHFVKEGLTWSSLVQQARICGGVHCMIMSNA